MPALKGVRLIACTGYGRDEDSRRIGEAGFERHLVKPVSATDLERILAASLRFDDANCVVWMQRDPKKPAARGRRLRLTGIATYWVTTAKPAALPFLFTGPVPMPQRPTT